MYEEDIYEFVKFCQELYAHPYFRACQFSSTGSVLLYIYIKFFKKFLEIYGRKLDMEMRKWD